MFMSFIINNKCYNKDLEKLSFKNRIYLKKKNFQLSIEPK